MEQNDIKSVERSCSVRDCMHIHTIRLMLWSSMQCVQIGRFSMVMLRVGQGGSKARRYRTLLEQEEQIDTKSRACSRRSAELSILLAKEEDGQRAIFSTARFNM